jgi:hypothetical protein
MAAGGVLESRSLVKRSETAWNWVAGRVSERTHGGGGAVSKNVFREHKSSSEEAYLKS